MQPEPEPAAQPGVPTQRQDPAGREYSYHEFRDWLEHAEKPQTVERAFAYAFGAGQVYQANRDDPDALNQLYGLATMRIPREMLNTLLAGSTAMAMMFRMAEQAGVALPVAAQDLAKLDDTIRTLRRSMRPHPPQDEPRDPDSSAR